MIKTYGVKEKPDEIVHIPVLIQRPVAGIMTWNWFGI